MSQLVCQDTQEVTLLTASCQDHLPPLKRRAGHRKSRTGCNNCKQRHLKCDEEKPTCVRCQRANEFCQWRSAPQLVSRGRRFRIETTRTMRISALDSAAAVDAFEFFDLHTLPILRECHPSILWRSTFGFLAQSSVAFRKIAIALGFQHRGLTCGAGAVRVQLLAKADISYTQALHSLRLSLRRSDHPLTTAFGCMLLVLLSSLRDDHSDFLVHLTCGLDILKKMNRQTKDLGEVRGINAILQHYCINTWLYSCSPLYNGPTGQLVETLQPDIDSYPDAQIFEFPSLELSNLVARLMLMRRPSNEAKREAWRLAQLQQLLQRTNALENALGSLQDGRYVSATSFAVLKASLVVYKCNLDNTLRLRDEPLRLSIESSTIALDYIEIALNELSQIGHDRQTRRGDGGQTPLFSIDLGMLQLLDIIVKTSNDEDVQDRALSLSKRCPKAEGMWVASKTGQVIQEYAAKRVF